MTDIDYIMELLDWNRTEEEQAKGRELARDVKSINVFLQPKGKNCNKNVWDNCAFILAERSDEELGPYLLNLMAWLEDMNWPGAFCILDRLNRYADTSMFNWALEASIELAKATHAKIWRKNLKEIKRRAE